MDHTKKLVFNPCAAVVVLVRGVVLDEHKAATAARQSRASVPTASVAAAAGASAVRLRAGNHDRCGPSGANGK